MILQPALPPHDALWGGNRGPPVFLPAGFSHNLILVAPSLFALDPPATPRAQAPWHLLYEWRKGVESGTRTRPVTEVCAFQSTLWNSPNGIVWGTHLLGKGKWSLEEMGKLLIRTL